MPKQKQYKSISNTGKPGEVNEPSSSYSRLQIFHSFEEENEAVYKERALISPGENMAYTTSLIKRVYADALKHYKTDKQIHFH